MSMAADASQRDPLRIADRAIGRLREEMREPQQQFGEARVLAHCLIGRAARKLARLVRTGCCCGGPSCRGIQVHS